MAKYILAIDQGTTSSRAIVFDDKGNTVATAQYEFRQIMPQNGWVEHDAEEIYATTLKAIKEAVKKAGKKISAIGITNQRETTILWNKKTGKPIYNAIVWQDRRTAEQCKKLKKYEAKINSKTGLVVDPYFSATKIAWILDNVKGARAAAAKGEILFGTVDSWLLWKLAKTHATDATNASRTMVFNINNNKWDDELLKLMVIPKNILPVVKDSAANFGSTDVFGYKVPITGIAGDQQAALFGQQCFAAGTMKSTYGTGCFLLVNTGSKIIKSKNRLLSTIAYRLNGKTTYALEGSIFIAGAAIQWLRDGLKVIKKSSEVDAIVNKSKSNKGVYLVPAFTGLGAPYWAPQARGAIFGLTRDTSGEDLVRAAVESVCYQTHDLISAIKKDGVHIKLLKVDGGMAKNKWFLKFLADITATEIKRPPTTELTALGAAHLAAIGAGISSFDKMLKKPSVKSESFTPSMPAKERIFLINQWEAAVKKVVNKLL